MVIIILHIACITCLVTNNAWNAHDVIGVYRIRHRAVGISYIAELAILRFAGAVLGEVGALNI